MVIRPDISIDLGYSGIYKQAKQFYNLDLIRNEYCMTPKWRTNGKIVLVRVFVLFVLV